MSFLKTKSFRHQIVPCEKRKVSKRDGTRPINGWRKNVRINPNNFYKRELDILPPHFVNTVVKAHEADVEKMRKWIYENCHGRYSITKDIKYEGDTSRSCTVIGFENPGDLTLFALSGVVAQINQN